MYVCTVFRAPQTFLDIFAFVKTGDSFPNFLIHLVEKPINSISSCIETSSMKIHSKEEPLFETYRAEKSYPNKTNHFSHL